MIENKIKKVMSTTFNIDLNEISDNSSPNNIDKWDSMAHMNLIVELEKEFDLLFDANEITEMINFKSIMLIVSDHIKEN